MPRSSSAHTPRSHCRQRRRTLVVVATAALSMFAAGCTRSYYHRQADREISRIVTQKTLPGRWGIPGFNVEYDHRSRYFDPTNPDRPPMPPDDPYSHVFMHYVDGKRNAARSYHRDGDLSSLPNPQWRELLAYYTDVKPDGTVVLTLDGAVQLARIHSPPYQTQLEELYLSALDVSTERWRFDAQFFGNVTSIYTHQEKLASRTGTVSNELDVETALQMQKQFAAGGELIAGFANSFIWQFAGPDTLNGSSLLNFSFVQPLLRSGGRRFILERLTIVERIMLANLRAFERYRQGFYTNLAIGDGGVPGPQRRGGFFGGTGLAGFSGQGSGGFGEVGSATAANRNGNNNGGGAGGVGSGFTGGGAGNVGGYVGILQVGQQVRNNQQNLDAQLRVLKLLEANLDAGVIDIAQVDQFRQNIETARATLLQNEINRVNSLETFKRSILGLPPDLPMDLDDTMIRQFELIERTTNDLYERIEDLVDDLGDLPVEPEVELLASILDQIDAFRGDSGERLRAIRADLDGMIARRDERKKVMTADEASLFDKEIEKTEAVFAEIVRRFEETGPLLAELRGGLNPATRRLTLERSVSAAKGLATLVQEASLVQVRARLESVTLDPVRLDMRFALDIARANRLDWMNNRAAVVDTWRLIAFNARQLMSTLNLTFDGSLGTRNNHALNFNAANSTLRAGVTFDAPFTRLLERNSYRAVLIDYQRDRRQLIQFEDQVNQTLRQSLRTLRQQELNLEIQRRAVAIATRRVDQTRETLSKPPDPVIPGQPATAQFGPTAALNLLTALNDLQGSQNNFMSVWLNHYATRMVLMRELGVMELDDRGIWIDRPLDEILATVAHCPGEPLPPEVPDEWIRALEGEQVPTPSGSVPAPGGGGPSLVPPGELLPNPPDDKRPSDLPNSSVGGPGFGFSSPPPP